MANFNDQTSKNYIFFLIVMKENQDRMQGLMGVGPWGHKGLGALGQQISGGPYLFNKIKQF